jgi:hypothetical protein
MKDKKCYFYFDSGDFTKMARSCFFFESKEYSATCQDFIRDCYIYSHSRDSRIPEYHQCFPEYRLSALYVGILLDSRLLQCWSHWDWDFCNLLLLCIIYLKTLIIKDKKCYFYFDSWDFTKMLLVPVFSSKVKSTPPRAKIS